jgi:cytosine deaminase
MVRASPSDVYAIVAGLALDAARQGTFGVGGVLAAADGRIVARARNAVVAGGRVQDPTAHVERQLIDWYFGTAPHDLPPSALTIVSSLEPCMMCAGSILRAGFKCVALIDDDDAGVGIRRGMPTLPPSLQPRARAAFGSAAVRGRRAFAGSGAEPFRREASDADFEATMDAFDTTRKGVRRITAGGGLGSRVTAGTTPADVVSVVLDVDRDAVWSADGSARGAQDFALIAERLRGDGTAAGVVDETGRLVFVAAGRTSRSPIRTAVMECVRGVVRERPRLEHALGRALPPSDLRLLVAGAPRDEEEAIIALGAAGSFVEAPLDPEGAPFVQVVGGGASHVEWLARTLGRFPSFYRDFVGLRVGPASRA